MINTVNVFNLLRNLEAAYHRAEIKLDVTCALDLKMEVINITKHLIAYNEYAVIYNLKKIPLDDSRMYYIRQYLKSRYNRYLEKNNLPLRTKYMPLSSDYIVGSNRFAHLYRKTPTFFV